MSLRNMIKKAVSNTVALFGNGWPKIQMRYMGQTKETKFITPYGLFSSPVRNSQFVVISVRNNSDDLVSIGNDFKYNPDLKEGEVLLVNTKTGDFIKMQKDGKVTISTKEATFTQDVIIKGDLQVDGDVNIDGDCIIGGISFLNHVHGGVESGGSNTAPPS